MVQRNRNRRVTLFPLNRFSTACNARLLPLAEEALPRMVVQHNAPVSCASSCELRQTLKRRVHYAANYVKRSVRARSPKRQERGKKRSEEHTSELQSLA